MLEGTLQAKRDEQLQVHALLKQIHLFYDLDDEQIDRIASLFSRHTYDGGHLLFSQGESGDSFYLILRGSVRVIGWRKGTETVLATLVAGDYFGEEALLYGRRRSASIVTNEPTTLLRLDKPDFDRLISEYPQIKVKLTTIAESRQLARRKRFNWLGEEEVIYLLARKHASLLVVTLFAPLVLSLFSLPFFWLSSLVGIVTPTLIGFLIVIAAGLWGLWRWVDWGNDYYIVTNQRVVWLEKIIGLHDSRQEAPLSTILSVSVESDPTGRVLGYGDVVVRTFTGKIVMRNVGYPQEMASLIEEYWQRTKKYTDRSEEEAMVQAIRQRLGLPMKREPRDPFLPRPLPIPVNRPPKKPSPLRLALASYFSTRFVDGSVITYRKHWFLFARRVWWHTLAVLLVVGFIVARYLGKFPYLSLRSVIVVGVSVLTVLAGLWLYEYVDWRDDKFQVTADHIIDIDRKPFGKEERKAAPLENILSLEHARTGIFGILFNFGDVSASVGGSKFVFEGVHDPAQVQQDIFLKMDARIKKKKEAQAASERARMASWLAAYHRNVNDFRPPPAPTPEEEEQEAFDEWEAEE